MDEPKVQADLEQCVIFIEARNSVFYTAWRVVAGMRRKSGPGI